MAESECGDRLTIYSVERSSSMPMVDSREVMNVRQASQYLGISADTLYTYVSRKRIPAFKLGNRWKFKKTTLDRWMVNQMARQSGDMLEE